MIRGRKFLSTLVGVAFSVSLVCLAEEPATTRSDAGATGTLSVNEVGDWPEICDKIILCHENIFDNKGECETAAESSIDDPVTAKTYKCVAKATSCSALAKCLPAKRKKKHTKKK